MEVVAGDLPFQRRNVVEWSHRDRLTGALERARRETNHWSASTANAIHNYGKVVDHRALNLADGRVQQTQRKQVEVFSTQVPGGSLQVFRSSTTSSSRSSMQFTQMSSGTWASGLPDVDTGFGDLQLSLHPLDLSSEKTKASAGRSIGWRRPPTRVTRAGKPAAEGTEKHVEITVEQDDDDAKPGEPIISFPSDDDSSEKAASVAVSSKRHSIAESRKSCSSENLSKVDADGAEAGANGFLGRSSVLRRSLQYTRPPDFPTGTSVRRMREEIEARGVTGGAPAAAAGTTAAPAAPALPKQEETLDKVKRLVSDSIATQNHSFVTVKSLAEVRGRLRSKDAKTNGEQEAGEDAAPQPYVFGMAKDKLVNGGSLGVVKSEEWYRRRKSYGFEPDLPPQNQELISLKEGKEDAWSDTGSAFKTSAAFSVSPLLKHLDTIKRSKDAANHIARPASLYEKTDSNETNGFKSLRLEDAASNNKTVVKLVGEDMERRRDLLRRRAERNGRNLTEPVSVSIPVVASDAVLVRADDQPTLLINGEAKRHSIAVADTEEAERDKHYLSDSAEDAAGHPKSNKKRVEFSKTEVHFAAEPGRFNLVSTDDKPPPTNIVRGRRRQRLLAEQRINRSGLPEVRFGDEQKQADDEPPKATGVITVTMEGKLSPDACERLQQQHPLAVAKAVAKDVVKDDGVVRCTVSADPDNGVPMWRSTVTLKNNSFTNERRSDGEAEFQRLLKSLRPTGKRGVTAVEPVPEITVTTSRSPTIVRPRGFSTTVNVGPPNGVEPVSFQHTTLGGRGSSEHTSALHSLKLSRLDPLVLESTPLVLLATSNNNSSSSSSHGRPRRRTRAAVRAARRSLASEEEDLSDDSLQADAEVRSYMLEKSRLVHLGIRDVSPATQGRYTPSPELGSPRLTDAADSRTATATQASYRHHASKAERLVQLDAGASLLERLERTASPNSVYILPEQRKSGFTAVPRSEFRTPSPVLPKSFSLVDSVARKADSQRETERTVSVRELLSRMAKAKTEAKAEAKKERIIEVVAAATDSASEADAPVNGVHGLYPELERVNGHAPTTDSVIFRDYRPTSPADASLTKAARRLTGQAAGHSAALVKEALKEDTALRAPAREAKETVEEPAAPRVRHASPLLPQLEQPEGREFLHCRAQPGGHHIDVVERFLRAERSHHDERRAAPRSRQDAEDAERRARRRRSHSRDAEQQRRAELERRSPRSPDHKERDRVFDEHGAARRRRSREELRVKESRRRSRSRDELAAADKRSRSREQRRSRSRSQDELEVDRQRQHGSGTRDALAVDEERERRHRSRSRDGLAVDREEQRRDDRRHRERSAEARHRGQSSFEASGHRQRSRSRDPSDQKREPSRGGRSHGEGVNGDAEDAVKGRRGADKAEDKQSGERKATAGKHAEDRRHRCKCADRGDKDPKGRAPARAHAPDKACPRSDAAAAERKARAERAERAERGDGKADKADKLVRKTRTHVAAIASPMAHLVTKPSRRQADSKKPGDIHIVIEPIRPVRRTAAPTKQSATSASSLHAKASAKAVLSPKRSAGTVSDSNSSLSQGKAVGNHHHSASEATRPTRRSHRKHTIEA